MLLGVERVRRELAGCVDGADEGRVGHRSRVWSDPVAVLAKQGGEHRQGAPAPLASRSAKGIDLDVIGAGNNKARVSRYARRSLCAASRWTLNGTHRRRQVRLWGTVISRLEDGQIVEDWAASDSLDLVRQLGVWRSVLLVVKHWRLLRS